jgi:hypothetical protein
MKSKSFKEDLEYRIYCLKHLGKKYGWRIIRESGNDIEFENIIHDSHQAVSVNMKITFEPIEIETQLEHPIKGETTLLRKGDISVKDMEQVFRNPRSHTAERIKTRCVR